MSTEETKVTVQPVDKAKVKHLVKIALYLFAITVVEFIFAFTMQAGDLRTTFFVLLTILKAYYIVYEFMHLGHEAKGLRWSVIFPMVLVLWLLVALLNEGGYIHAARF